MQPPERRRAIKLIWAALWRAQAVHLVLFVLVPAVLALLHVALGIALLPFTLLSFGDRTLALGHQVNHLRQPSCWLALAPCAVAEINLVPLPGFTAASDLPDTEASTSREPFVSASMPTALTPRHLWFFSWLAWFLVFLRRSRNAP